MMWFSQSNKRKRSLSRDSAYTSTLREDQPAETWRNASQTGTTTSLNMQQPGQIVQSHPNTSDRVDKCGLFLLNPQTPDPDGVEAEETYMLDIVALHGITGDAYDTWTHENGKLWLRDFLPKELPGARVFSFGYPAEVFFSLGQGDLDSFARSLLEDLKRERRKKEDQRRRIIFICHSMGGIVVKKALITALIDNEVYDDIQKSVTAILFLGTPHRGSDETAFPLVLASIANIALAGTSRFVGSMRSDLIKSLEKDSKILKDISTNFRNQTRDIKIASFIEQSITPPAKKRIVDNITGVMDIAGERIVPMPNCDHKSMCRFGAETSSGYKTVWGVLQDWADEVKQMTNNKPSSRDIPCLHSLAYPEMTYRRHEADKAYPNTCGWILKNDCYTTWMSKGRGLLWIKGKPGAGKSTLMAYIYRAFQDRPTGEQDLCLDFFFHGRGTTLQKTPIGMLRSLLHRLFALNRLVRGPIRNAFEEKRGFGEAGKDWEWQLKELQDLFFNAVLCAAKSQKVTIFVDALDEAGAEAGELVAYFHRLNDCLIDANGAARICISCRHYPVTATIPGLEISVEENNYEDISSYVQAELQSKLQIEQNTSDSSAWRELEDDLVERALGVFQWVRLVVPLVVKYAWDGESLTYISRQLMEVPEGLGAVYEHILKNIIEFRNRKRTLHLMQWVCLAERPLSVTELRFAMASDDAYILPSQLYCKDAKDFVETDARMEKLTTSLSGGLAEVKHHEHGSTVQFIHQSVNDFLLSDGLNFLVSATVDAFDQGSGHPVSLSKDEIIGRSQHRLSRSCINYLRLGEILRQDRITRKWIKQELPFIEYATKSWFMHAEKAESRGISQEELVQQFEPPQQVFDTWVKIFRTIDQYSDRCPNQGSTLLHIASSSNLQSTILILLQKGISVDKGDNSGNRALHYAARWGHKELMSMLLDAQAEIGAKNKAESTPLERAAGNGHEEIVKLLLRRGANINERTGNSGSALQAAALKGSISLVRTLVENGAEVNVQGGDYGSALQAAANEGDLGVVQLLLDRGAEVNAQGGHYGSALQAAASGGESGVVQLLLDHGAEVNAQGGEYGSALQAAAKEGESGVVQLLLDHGAEVNAQGGHYGSALEAAARWGHSGLVQLLLDRGAEVNAQGGYYGSALQAAAKEGYSAVVQLLLDRGAEANAQGGYYGSALEAAARWGESAVVQLLLDHGAEANAQGGHYGSALEAAARWGDSAVVQLLLDHGAEANAQGGHYGSALEAAARWGDSAVVQLLLDRGAKPMILPEHEMI